MQIRVADVRDNHIRIDAEFPRAELNVQESPLGAVLSLAGCRESDEPGAPSLPRASVRVALPTGMEVASLEVNSGEATAIFDKPTLIAPVQPRQPGPAPSPRSGGRPVRAIRAWKAPSESLLTAGKELALDLHRFATPRADLYERAAKQPRPAARLVSMQHAGPYTVAVIEINPVRLRPDGIAELYTSIAIDMALRAVSTKEVSPPDRATSQALASRFADLVRASVANPKAVIDIGHTFPIFLEYLVITDDYLRDAATGAAINSAGTMTAEFQRLANWKASRGVSSKVVSIQQILDKMWGDFQSGARDLPETIRNFLRWAHSHWNIKWVLLGGDVGVVPIRYAAGLLEGGITEDTNDKPDPARSKWMGTHPSGAHLRIHSKNCGVWFDNDASNELLRVGDGTVIPYDASGTAALGWFFCTDDNYDNNPSVMKTEWVRVNGPEASVHVALRWLYHWNMIPTDFYYSTLTGYPAGMAHHWDLNNTGVYGLIDSTTGADSIRWTPDVSVGRAPVQTQAEAKAFVDKVIAYEKFRGPHGILLEAGWPQRFVLAGSNWGGRWWLGKGGSPPNTGQYSHVSGADHAILHLDDGAAGFDKRVLSQVSETEIHEIPYAFSIPPSGLGWHFAKSATDPTPPTITVSFLGHTHTIHLVSEWIAAYAPPSQLEPQGFIIDQKTLDGSIADQEQLRHQAATDLPWLHVMDRLYSDWEDLPPAEAAEAPLEELATPRLRAALNASPHVVSLSGHGSPWSGCCGLDTGMAGGLSNGFTTFIGYADSCLTNAFDEGDSMGETLVKNGGNSAVGFIGNTRFSWIGLGDDVQREFFSHLKTTQHLGLLNDSRCGHLGAWPLDAYNRWILMSLNLTGDPEMPVWKDSPWALMVKTSAFDPRTPLQVHVTRRRGLVNLNVQHAFVHVLVGTNWVKTGYTAADGTITFDVRGAPEAKVIVTASAPNCIPAVATIHRVPLLPWVKGVVDRVVTSANGPTEVRLKVPQTGAAGAHQDIAALIDQAQPNAAGLVEAATRAHLGRYEAWFLVNDADGGGRLEKVALGNEPPPRS